MALPALEKTWGSSNMILNSTNATDSGNLWRKLKDTLIAISPGWTLAGSGGAGAGGGGGMDAVDRWTSDPVVNNWVVLQNNAIATGFQLLIRPQNTAFGWYNGINIAVSPGGLYVGGGQTTTPTATDEVQLTTWGSNTFYRNGTAAYTARLNVWMSSDGECTRIVFCETGATRGFMLFDKVKNPVSGWTIPWVGAVAQMADDAARVPEYTDLNDVSTLCKSYANATEMPLFWTSEAWVAGMMGERLTAGNDLDSNGFPLSAIGLASETVGVRGRHGELFDIWWGSNIVADGGHYPGLTPRQFVQVGDIVLPWDPTLGSALLLA